MLKKIMDRAEELDEQTLQIHLSKKKKMVIRNRCQIMGYLNDTLLGVLYLIGSILFLSNSHRILAISFFLAGSILMIRRAVILILRDIHLMKYTDEDL